MNRRDCKLTNAEVRHRNAVRQVFNSTEGKEEFLRMMVDFGMFRRIEEPDLALRNYGIHKLEEMGFLDIELIEEFVDWLFTTQLAYRPTVEEMGEDIENDPLFSG